MIYAGNCFQSAELISITRLAFRSLCAIFLQFGQQLGKLAEEAQFCVPANGILSTRRWQNEYQGAVQTLLLKSQLTLPLRKVLIGGFAVEGDHLGRILLQLLRQYDAALGELLATQFVDAARRPLDEIGQPDSKLNHTLVILMIEKLRHDA